MSVAPAPARRRTKASPRKRSAEILAAAARVFAERGYYGATTQDIADVLGIRQASLYYYFPSKEVALESVCIHGAEAFHDAATAIGCGPGTSTERLSRLIESHLTPLIDRRDFVKVFLNERQYLPTESRRRIGKWSQGVEQTFEAVIRQGVAEGEFRADADPRLTTLAILGMANAVPVWFDKEGAPLGAVIADMTALVLNGLRPRAERTRRK